MAICYHKTNWATYSASRWCRYMLHFLDKSAAAAASPLYKACVGIFLIKLLISCTELRESVHC